MRINHCDVLIIGSGIAGLYLSYKLAILNPNLKINLITKSNINNSNSRYAQGGIAAVINKSSKDLQSHITDTLNAGGNLNDKKVVEFVINNANFVIEDLIKLGVQFDKNSHNDFHFGLEGGHSNPRILHCKDYTGLEIIESLIIKIKQFNNINIVENCRIIKLSNNSISNNSQKNNSSFLSLGINLSNNKLVCFKSDILVIASGGLGQVFDNTTNPKISSGDGIYLASEIGAVIENLQYIQFHPTALKRELNEEFNSLISEAIRGFGAYIVNQENFRFLLEYDKRGELATRDIITNGIIKHIKQNTHNKIFLDLRHLNILELKNEFPTIFQNLINKGYNPSLDLIPIIPAAHYQCGGIKINLDGETNIKNLYAVGEVANSGLHGNNRLASNSLLEALVFANQIALHISKYHQTNNHLILNQKNKKINSQEVNKLSKTIQLIDIYEKSWCLENIKILKSKLTNFFFNFNTENINDVKSSILNIETEIKNKFNDYEISESLFDLKVIIVVIKLILKESNDN